MTRVMILKVNYNVNCNSTNYGHQITYMNHLEKGQQSLSGTHVRWPYLQSIGTEIPM